MRYVKLVPALLAIVFALLSFTDILNQNVSMTLMMIFLGIANLVVAKENFVNNKKMAYGYLVTGIMILGTMVVVSCLTIFF